MANFTCAGWAARAKLTTFARTAGGIICTTSPARDDLTPTGRTDGATTFDSPFPANLLAVWGLGIPLLPASGQGGRFLMAFQGILCFIPPVLRAGAVPRRPLPVFFWPGIFCTQNFVCKAWAESPPMGGDLSAGRRVPVPHARTLEDETSFTTAPGQPDDGGDARRRARKEHTARQAERARQTAGGTTAETAATAGRAPRAQPTLANGQRTREVVPLPPLKLPPGCAPRRGKHEEGKGGAPRGRGGGRGTTRRETERSAPPHRQPNAGTAANDSARRRAAGAKQGGKPDDSPPRGRKTERGQRPSRPGRRRRDGQRARKPPPPRPTPQHGANHASGRRNGGETDGDGAGRAETGRESQAAAPKPPAQKNAETGRHSTRATDAEAANHGGHGRQHARTPGGGTLRERADGQRAESATGQRQEGGRARESPDKAAEGSGRSGGAPTAQPNAESSANAESRPPDRGPPLRPL